ncbi:hypothetical protein CYMTET_11986 [Cymbomonas tetramitiformis]|uniref:Uncharacterized protein n=1 Tax=Cymbomonas tetramitiformis TaxID=36881 RepID=A0AAE0GMM5_9CHLO|nr:hypothetical protein CYMTET_11986 [Cymbomonas tetramitiformis]
MWFQLDDYGLSATGAYRLELHQKSISEAKELLQQMREDPHNSLERCKFSVFAVNINKPGEIVGRGVSIQDVRKAVLTAVKEEEPRVAPKPRSREPGPSSRTRREPQRDRKPGRAPASSPGHPSSGEASSSSSEVARERRELQELKAALQKESRAREAAAEALMEKLSQQLQESREVAEERRASEQRATKERRASERRVAEERRASEQRAAEERWAAEQLAAETREPARRLAIEESVARQLAADERQAEDRRLAEIQLEERLQAVIESQIRKLALVQTSPLGPTELDARGPVAELSGPASETPTSRPGQELVEPSSVVTRVMSRTEEFQARQKGRPWGSSTTTTHLGLCFPPGAALSQLRVPRKRKGGWSLGRTRLQGCPGVLEGPEVREEVGALEVLESPEAREETGVPEGLKALQETGVPDGPEALEEAGVLEGPEARVAMGVPEGLKAREGPVVIRREIRMIAGMAKATVPSVLSPLLAVLALSRNAR